VGYLFCYFALRRFPNEAEKTSKKTKAEKIAAGKFGGWEGSTSAIHSEPFLLAADGCFSVIRMMTPIGRSGRC
jgi:hypothetical protein